jgi:hypothetical protein
VFHISKNLFIFSLQRAVFHRLRYSIFVVVERVGMYRLVFSVGAARSALHGSRHGLAENTKPDVSTLRDWKKSQLFGVEDFLQKFYQIEIFFFSKFFYVTLFRLSSRYPWFKKFLHYFPWLINSAKKNFFKRKK